MLKRVTTHTGLSTIERIPNNLRQLLVQISVALINCCGVCRWLRSARSTFKLGGVYELAGSHPECVYVQFRSIQSSATYRIKVGVLEKPFITVLLFIFNSQGFLYLLMVITGHSQTVFLCQCQPVRLDQRVCVIKMA